MSEENDPNAVLAMQAAQNDDPLKDAERRLAETQAELARTREALASANVVRPANWESPRYFLNNAVYLEDCHYPGGCTIEWEDTPNLEMVPLNEPAKQRMKEFIAHLEYGARKKAQMQGRDFFGLVTDRNVLIDQAFADAKTQSAAPVVSMPVKAVNVPAMPTTDDAVAERRRNPPKGSKVGRVESPTGTVDRGAPMLPAVVGRRVS